MKQDKVIGGGLLAFCALAGFLTTHLDKSTMEGEPGPKFFPTLIIIMLAILSAILLARKGAVAEPGVSKKDDEFSTREALVFFIVFLSGLAAMYFVGFVPSLSLTVAAMTWLSGWKIPKALAFSVGVMVAVYLLFDRLLEIPLPLGLFFQS